jgi:hypothetical protein
VFFAEDIASDRGAGAEILQGTALRMPKVPDYESFRRIIDKVSCASVVKQGSWVRIYVVDDLF